MYHVVFLHTDQWISGPSLMQARSNHAAGLVTDEVTGEDFVAVTGGLMDLLDSTEILQDGEWVQGKISNILICYLLENFLVAKYSYIMSYY